MKRLIDGYVIEEVAFINRTRAWIVTAPSGERLTTPKGAIRKFKTEDAARAAAEMHRAAPACGKCRDTGWQQTRFAGLPSSATCECVTGRRAYAAGMREASEDLQKLNPH